MDIYEKLIAIVVDQLGVEDDVTLINTFQALDADSLTL